MKSWLLSAAVLVPVSVSAQTRASIGPYVAVDEGLPIPQTPLFGLSAGTDMGILALRASGAAASELRAWTLDADAMLGSSTSVSRALGFGGGIFVGIGAHAAPTSFEKNIVPTWSYGATLRYAINDWLDLETVGRHRNMLNTNNPVPSGFTDGWEYRAGFALHTSSRRAVRTASAPFPSSPRSGTGRSTASTASASTAALTGHAVLNTGDDYIGTKYTWGGDSPREGFDCSGFVQYVFRKHGIELPRTSRQQAVVGTSLPTRIEELVPGDLMMFAENGRIDHVAIYAGNYRILHSTSSGRGVRYDDLTAARGRWYVQHFAVARRVTDGSMSRLLDFKSLIPAFTGYDPPDHAPRVN